jgi:hypothetical protein
MTTNTAPTRWEATRFTMPMPFRDPPRDWRQLGELRGRRWWLSKWGELEEDDQLTLVNAVTADTFVGPLLIELDDIGREAGRRLRVHPPGTFAQRTSAKPKAPPARELADVLIVGSHLVPLAAGRPIDALAELSTFATVHGHAERRPIRGAAAILAHLRGKRGHLVGGLTRAHVLLLPFLRDGREPVCDFGCGRTATTTAEASPSPLAWCGTPCHEEAYR